MTAANILSDELTRTRRLLERERALRTVADMQVQAERDFCDAIAERLSTLVGALAEYDVIVVDGKATFPSGGDWTPERLALGAAIDSARVAIDHHHAARFGEA